VVRADLERALASGSAREAFASWARAQGADPAWLDRPDWALAPDEVSLRAPVAGALARVECRTLGLLLAEAGAGRAAGASEIDFGVSLLSVARLGDRVAAGDELARVYLRRRDDGLERRLQACFTVAEHGTPPLLIGSRITVDEKPTT
jgi:thymidine phosphorylase